MRRLDDEEEALPSWLENSSKTSSGESKPLIYNLHKAGSYGGQSTNSGASGGSTQLVQEDYGANSDALNFGPIMGGSANHNQVDTSWTIEPSMDTKNRNLGAARGMNTNPRIQEESEYESESEDVSDDGTDEEYTTEENDDETYESEEHQKNWFKDEENYSPETKTPTRTKEKQKSRKNQNIGRGKKKKSVIDSDDESRDYDDDGIIKRPRRNCCHSFFIVVQLAAILANLTMIAFQVAPIIIGKLDVLDKVLRCYFTLFSICFFLAEFECFPGLENWMSRGFLYTFFGVVVKEQHVAMFANGSIPKEYWDGVWTNLIIAIASWWIIGIGCLYFFLGMICLKRVRDRCREHYRKKVLEYNKWKYRD